MNGTTDGTTARIDENAAVSRHGVSRRGFLRATAGATAVAGAAGTAGVTAAQTDSDGSGDDSAQMTGGLPSRFAPIGTAALAAMGLVTVATLYLTLLGVRDDRTADALVVDEE